MSQPIWSYNLDGGQVDIDKEFIEKMPVLVTEEWTGISDDEKGRGWTAVKGLCVYNELATQGVQRLNTEHRRVEVAPHRCVGRVEAECHWQSYWTVAAKAENLCQRRDITSNILLNETLYFLI